MPAIRACAGVRLVALPGLTANRSHCRAWDPKNTQNAHKIKLTKARIKRTQTQAHGNPPKRTHENKPNKLHSNRNLLSGKHRVQESWQKQTPTRVTNAKRP